MSRTRNAIVATGLVAFAAAGLAFPFYMASRSSKMNPVIDSSKPLPPQATFRGLTSILVPVMLDLIIKLTQRNSYLVLQLFDIRNLKR